MVWFTLLCCLLIVNAAVDYTTVHIGHLTFYGSGADSGGTCMYNNPKINLNLPTVAIGNFGNAEKCGTCVKITPKGTGSGVSDFPNRKPFVAFVNNQCPECGEDHLDLAESSDGVWDISWQFVECPVSGNIQLQLKTGSSKWHTEISARNFKTAIKSLEYETSANNWVALARQPYNYFVLNSAVTLPVNVRLTSLNGDKQTLTLTEANYGLIEPSLISTSCQFPGGSPTPTGPTPTPTTKPPTPTPSPSPSKPTPSPSNPTAPTSSTYTCKYESNGDWWVELTHSGKTSQAVYLLCSDNTKQNCEFKSDWGKYACAITGKACTAPRRAYIDGTCCSLDSNSCAAKIIDEQSSNMNGPQLTTGGFVGVILATIVITAIVVGLIVYRLARRPAAEHV